MDLIELATGHE